MKGLRAKSFQIAQRRHRNIATKLHRTCASSHNLQSKGSPVALPDERSVRRVRYPYDRTHFPPQEFPVIVLAARSSPLWMLMRLLYVVNCITAVETGRRHRGSDVPPRCRLDLPPSIRWFRLEALSAQSLWLEARRRTVADCANTYDSRLTYRPEIFVSYNRSNEYGETSR